jgi:hypothetical protein
MTAATTGASATRLPSFRTILAAGIGGGAVDFVYPTVLALARGRPADSPWRSVASGWIGKTASEGAAPVALGIVTHFAIAIVMALAFAVAATRLPVLYRRPWISGLLYGFVLYGVMYGIVLPTRFGRPYHWTGGISVMDIAAHIGVALVIALVLSRKHAR